MNYNKPGSQNSGISIVLMETVKIVTIPRAAIPIGCAFHASGLAVLVETDNQLPRFIVVHHHSDVIAKFCLAQSREQRTR